MMADVPSTAIECAMDEPLTTPGIVKGRPPALQWWGQKADYAVTMFRRT